ncbi:acyltransferase [Pelodictyon phaeoclathratiforme]|jgi:acetyltransferase-like isoleucine patch superfamily enzyme|uniref:Transferase hexapeptide repeat containing protein n=1 Tax=Pelodictyon phaeoclathratiforme (strain DSM 5477 / BU-1) TaxID=324925 RepID=B4SDC1_PELPB|nr:acyltransferase [Pelodictyon phaeoclathratiforme]ACF42860.1 transferase hexapeptide repeat containing protein [Pelodictyon phaeoclathratiforme BU-1]
MVTITELLKRIRYWSYADRIGPDILLTHWRLYFKSSMKKLCKNKFKSFGDSAEFRPGAYAEACSKIEIGNHVVIRPGTFLFADPTVGGGGIIIEDKVLIGCGVHFYTNNHKFSDVNKPIFDQGYPESNTSNSIILRSGCWIGAGVIILPNVVIGENAVVGAGSVVTKSIPPRVVVGGNPAKILKNLY